MPRPASTNGPKKGKAPKAHKLAEQFPPGTVLRDTKKKEWKLGQILGQGGFGLIYHASEVQDTDKSANYVIKIEPSTNGPLYCEMNFYIRAAQKERIKAFVSSSKLKYLAVPPFLGNGMHTHNTQCYRFLVIPRFGRDLQKVLTSSGGTFPDHVVFAIGLRMIDALQYLHENEYVHADIKASNIMLGYSGGREISNEVYLCDYGLAYRYMVSGDHKVYKEDPRKAHDGTIEFTSRDAHKGVFPARRSDLEILGYCMLQWLCGKLPWEDRLHDQNYVASRKSHYMGDIRTLIKDSLGSVKSSTPDTMLKYMGAISQLDYEEEPDYVALKALLKSGLVKAGQKDEWKIEFSSNPKASKRKSTDSSTQAKSPKQRKTASPKKASVSSKKSSIVSSPPVAGAKVASSTAKKRQGSPVKKAVNGVGPHKKTPSTSTSSSISRKSPKSTRRRVVRKKDVVVNDAAIQTTPGLERNR